MKVDFTFYQEQYLGHLPQTLFSRFVLRAEAFLRFACGEGWWEQSGEQAAKMALCAVAEEMEKLFRKEGVKAETAGEYAVSYRDGDSAAALYQAAKLYLPEKLLYRGCGR